MAAIYYNVWAQGDYIYHSTPSGIDVYNDDASSKISFISLPAFEQENRVYVVFSEPTPYDNYPAPVTLSGGSDVYSYTTAGLDIHFKDLSNNELDFWIENWAHGLVSDLWVKVPASGTTSIYMYFNHDAELDFDHGNESASAIFYDDFSTIHPGTTGLSSDWTIAPEVESQFLVDGSVLRVTGLNEGPGQGYAPAAITIDKGYKFGTIPMKITSDIDVVTIPGYVGTGYNQYIVSLTGGSQGRDSWGWYIDSGLFDQSVVHTDSQAWHAGSGGITAEGGLVSVYFQPGSIRAVVDRPTNPFDITYSGTTRLPEEATLGIFNAHDFIYDVQYVKVTDLVSTCSGTTSGTVDTVNYPIISSPSSVWANDSDIYMGTTTAGLYVAPVSAVSGSSTVTGTAYRKFPNITSNEVIYVHGAGDYLCTSTVAGVDRYDVVSGTRIYTQDENIYKCHQLSDGTIYYIENNLFFSTDEQDLGDVLRAWKYYQLLYCAPTSMANSQVRVVFDVNFPYYHTKEMGEDIRFLDKNGNNLSYYIEDWYPYARILVNVLVAGTTEFYMLYGNPNAQAQSNIEETYYFYDGFSSLDSNVWSTYKGHSSNFARAINGYLDLYDYDNSGTAVVTNTRLPYSMLIKARIRHDGGTTSQMDNLFGYTTIHTKNRPNAGYVVIDAVQGTNDKLHYLHAVDTAIQGTTALSTTWYEWSGVWAPGFQQSTFRGETLQRSSNNATFEDENYFMFHIDNSSSNPNIQVDWLSFETWPLNTAYTNEEKILWDFIKPALHAVYTPIVEWSNSDYTYDDFYTNPLFLNDLHITEGTSTTSGNTIFLATDRGAHVIDERQGDEANADVKRYFKK